MMASPSTTESSTTTPSTGPGRSSHTASSWCRWWANRAQVGIVAAWLVTIAAWGGRWHWFFDAMNHTRWHVAWACLLAFVVCWLASRRRWAGCAMLCVLVNLAVVQPWRWYLPGPNSSVNGPTVRLLFWNIHAGQRDIDAVLELVEEHQPDVLAILELHPSHVDGLEALRDNFVTFQEHPRTDSFGLATYSKRPVQWAPTKGDPPMIRGVVDVGAEQLHFWAIHVLPPMGGEYLRQRNKQFRSIVDFLQKTDTPSNTIIGGDFNITPWCREFREFASDSGLIDSRLGHGYQASWPSKLGWFGIPIDHVLVTPETKVLKRETLRAGGISDHAAVLLTVQLASDTGNAMPPDPTTVSGVEPNRRAFPPR